MDFVKAYLISINHIGDLKVKIILLQLNIYKGG